MSAFEVGLARVDVTVFEPGMLMLGWAHPRNVALGVATPLYARAVAMREVATGRRWVYVCADLCFISLPLRRRVVAELRRRAPERGYDEGNVTLAATHTHSGPSGFGGHLYYDISGPGFSDAVFSALVDGIVEAIVTADAALAPARVYLHRGELPLSDAVMFHRAMGAYNRNADVDPLPDERRDEAVDRTLRALRFDDLDGNPLGALCWFPLHGTTIHHQGTSLHGDHSGLAAASLERRAMDRWGARDFVAVFAQEAAGDVTPNYRWDKRRGHTVGRYDDDRESASYCAEAQARLAESVLARAPTEGVEVTGPLVTATRYVAMAERAPDPRFTEGREVKTTRATLGLAMALGTDEGPGPLHGARWTLGLLRDRRANAVDAKVPFIDLGLAARGRVLDRWRSDHPWMHSLPLPAMRHFRALAGHGALGEEWVPSVVPVQVARLGPLALVALPCEPSVVAGRRLRSTALRAMGEGAREVVVNGYANAYCSYLVTAEEYGAQSYEGGCTLFGPWTLALYQTEVAALAESVAKDDVDVGCGAEPPPADLRQLGLGRYRPRRG